MKDILWAKGLLQISYRIRDKFHAKMIRKILNKRLRKIRTTTTWRVGMQFGIKECSLGGIGVEIDREEIVSSSTIEVILGDVTGAENDIPFPLINHLPSTTNGDPYILSGQHMTHHSFAPMNCNMAIEDGPSDIKRSI